MGGLRSHEPTRRGRTAHSRGPGARLRRCGTDSRRVQRRGGKHSLGGGDGCAGEFVGPGGVATGNCDSLQAANLGRAEFLPGPTAAIANLTASHAVRSHSSGVMGRVAVLTAEGSSRSLRYKPVSLGCGTLSVAPRKPVGTGAVCVN